jgi:small conductance mechanosensitive channel
MPKPASQTEEISLGVVVDLGHRFLTWAATSGLRIVVILVLTWVALFVVGRVTRQLEGVFADGIGSSERLKRAETLSSIVRTVAVILVMAAATMMIMNEVGIQIGPILATAGIGGLAVGFGAQSLVKDVISGFFLLMEDQVRVGDTVDIGGKKGIVETITLRTMRLRDWDGALHVIPHGTVGVVTNLTRDYSRYVFALPLPADRSPKDFFAMLREIGDELRNDADVGKDLLGPVEIFDVDTAGGNLVVKGRITTRPSRQWEVGRAFSLRLREKLAKNDRSG